MLGDASKNKKSTLSSVVTFFSGCGVLPLTDDNFAVTKDEIIYIHAGETICHIRCHFLSFFNLQPYYSTVLPKHK